MKSFERYTNLKDLLWGLIWLIIGLLALLLCEDDPTRNALIEIVVAGAVVFVVGSGAFFKLNSKKTAALNLVSLLIVSLLALQVNSTLAPILSLLMLSVVVTDTLVYLLNSGNQKVTTLEMGYVALATWHTMVIFFGRQFPFLHTAHPSPKTILAFEITTFIGTIAQILWFYYNLKGLVTMAAEGTALRKEAAWLRHFLGIINHQVRSPLATVQMRFELIDLRKSLNQDVNALDQDLEYIKQAHSKVISTTDAILEGVRYLESHNSGSLETLINDIRQQHNLDPITCPPLPTMMHTELLSLKMALEAATDNAFKYGATEVDIFMPDANTIIVQDNGPGMSHDTALKLGNKFHVHDGSGSGMGMVLIRKILNEVEWNLLVESEIGRGTKIIYKRVI